LHEASDIHRLGNQLYLLSEFRFQFVETAFGNNEGKIGSLHIPVIVGIPSRVINTKVDGVVILAHLRGHRKLVAEPGIDQNGVTKVEFLRGAAYLPAHGGGL
jgi:hypothetical protein